MLRGQVVVVAGGAGFLGRSFVRAIVENGGVVVVADLDTEATNRVVAEIATVKPGHVESATLNIGDKSSVTALIEFLQERREF